MATVIRVKRRLDAQPQDALVLCKRAKLNDDESETPSTSIPAIAKFAGTLKDPEEDIVHHLATTLNQKELNIGFKQHTCTDILARVRKEVKENSIANRYKVVKGFRMLDTSNVTEFKDKVLTFVDVEDSNSLVLNGDAASTENTDCVYDVYYTETEKVENSHIDDHVSIYTVYEHELWNAYREEGLEDSFESEDSNSESNWRNDYPDSDKYSDQSNSETSLKQSESLSTDDEDEHFAYSLNEVDVELHGYKYAHYKQRMQKLFSDEHKMSSNDDDSDDSSHKIYR